MKVITDGYQLVVMTRAGSYRQYERQGSAWLLWKERTASIAGPGGRLP